MKVLITTVVLCALVTSVSAQSLGDKIVGGIKKGTQAVGDGASTVVGAVEGTIDSTSELFSSDENPSETRERLNKSADQSLARLFDEQPRAEEVFFQSVGYAVFDARKVTLAGFSGGAGRGVAVDPLNNRRVYMKMTTAGVGLALGIGGFESQLVVFFENSADFERFITQGYDASANAGTMLGDESSEVEMGFRDGRAVFVLSKKGWRVAASATGSKFWPDKDLN